MKTKQEKREMALKTILRTIASGKSFGGFYHERKIREARFLMNLMGYSEERIRENLTSVNA